MDAGDYLRQLPLFAELDGEEVMDVLRIARLVQLEKGEYLCRAGEAGDCMFVIEKGVATVRAADSAGKMVEIAKLGEGELIGELALVDGQPRSADVRALTALTAYRIDRKGFDEMRTALHPAVFKMLKHVASTVSWRLREINAAVSNAMAATDVKAVQKVDLRSTGGQPAIRMSRAGPPPAALKPEAQGSGFWRTLVNRISRGQDQ